MTRLIQAILTLALCLERVASTKLNILDNLEDAPPPQDGRICAYGDVNKDRYTDLIVQFDRYLIIQLQSETGRFAESPSKYPRIDIGHIGDVDCVVGDFNGDSLVDIMVTWVSRRNSARYESSLYIYLVSEFTPTPLNWSSLEPPSVMDVNGDGISDVIGFVGDEHKLYCIQGSRTKTFTECDKRFQKWDFNLGVFPGFSPIFVDLDGDYGSEIVFGMRMRNHTSKENRLLIHAWKLNEEFNWDLDEKLIKPLPDSWATNQFYGNPVVADFNADGIIDLLLPVCRDDSCTRVDTLLVWNGERWISLQLDLKDSEIIADVINPGGDNSLIQTKVIFRVGDFSLDGYPDLIATVRMNRDGTKVAPMIIENIEYPDNSNFTRKFELKTSPRLVMPAEMANGRIHMTSFFDLKEDGNLDLLVEYTPKGAKDQSTARKLDFIKCDDKGDTTFLKVQIFTNVCTNDCPTASSSELGSGITWHGACVYFTMSDSWGKNRVSEQCQLPQTSQRMLYSPFALFGLGRSPNFVDEVRMGSPRYTGNPSNQRSVLKQLVPNSRVIIVPPERDGTHWQSRLYLTPSQLIIQSLFVILSVCFILLVVVLVLHWREKQQDKRERQAQSNRFHFDAM